MKDLAARNCMAIGAGHCFIITLKNAFPINVLNAVKSVQEVCSVYCASANDVEVVLAAGAMGKGIMGVIDGESPKGMETPEDIAWRKDLLRKFGYKA
jgi:adenosine/AMP kinase